MIPRNFEEGEIVEVKLTDTDNQWVRAEVQSFMETRVRVKLFTPVVWVEKTITITKFLFFTVSTTITETSKLVDVMTLSVLLVRDPTD